MNIDTKTEYVEVERVVKDKVATRHIVLTLTEEEASAIAAVFGNVGGSIKNPDSPRQFTDKIYEKLGRLNVGYGSKGYRRFAGSISRDMEIGD